MTPPRAREPAEGANLAVASWAASGSPWGKVARLGLVVGMVLVGASCGDDEQAPAPAADTAQAAATGAAAAAAEAEAADGEEKVEPASF
ncbi:MAG: hypothetical protein RIF41_16775, partial [Polyangiaceae bacterium]